MAKTSKQLEVQERHIYNPEIDVCPHCGECLPARRHYQWRKTVQQLDKVVYVASQGRECGGDPPMVSPPAPSHFEICGYGD